MYKINRNECIECGFCSKICPKNAIVENKEFGYEITNICINCGLCAKKCPVSVIERVEG
ncbi:MULTISPECIES: 4Fe-4S binding protein [Psychrilyobacter]|uniref:4Fe-4S dicluster domain-containing protein n=1 Tax=Psychrilyobacter piezotolerans TaxID=2293438 RepID=A0ABX9KJ44_9FUSO|nr:MULTISPECIES: 4Fe-4S binding protein [Psychrilyobacter]MCS5420598.1 4Fe-4S binding protein [Psychrilyobacter sp. S5]NDI77382.1 4Fe-4S dicluster domain-containing protein [Psychrilyobacter piezotolerans]RDE63687.1 4Fe-4S dicluster domain-containing protein [Psychrilyobacter sp. S5]REI42031.1 4Fe-4S dicluster domain-containing protein [Psychrilyobacter piezotolerans]